MFLSGSNDEQPFQNSATNDVPMTDNSLKWKIYVVSDSNDRVVLKASHFHVSATSTLLKW